MNHNSSQNNTETPEYYTHVKKCKIWVKIKKDLLQTLESLAVTWPDPTKSVHTN